MQRLLLTSSLTALLLTGCGGGGDSSGSSPVRNLTPNPGQTYSGNRDPALLDQSNTQLFAAMVLGDSSSGQVLSRPSLESEPILQNQSEVVSHLVNLTRLQTSSNLLQARNVSDSAKCDFGGTVSVSGEVNDEAETGYLVYTFTNCKNDEGITLNGKASETIHSNYDPELITLAYDDLKVTQDGESFSLTGSIDFSDDYQDERLVANLISVHSLTQYSTYLEEYTINRPGDNEGYADAISGRLFISNEGYVNVSTSSDYRSRVNTDSYAPVDGFIFINGASQSIARAMPAKNEFGSVSSSEYRLDLDSSGDGVYNLTSLQEVSSDGSNPLEENEAPIAKITANIDGIGDAYDESSSYQIGTSFYLRGLDSYDNDDFELKYTWTVEESPAGSTAEVVPDESDPFAYAIRFTPDVKGEYKISLKVTDPLGSQQNGIDFLDINILNIAPTLSASQTSDNEGKVRVNGFDRISVRAKDEDTHEGNPSLAISYEWIEQPLGSTAELVYSDENEYFPYYGGVEKTIYYDAKIDTAGVYKIRFTATDFNGESTTEIFEFDARNIELLTQDLYCLGVCDWDTGAAVVNSSSLLIIAVSSDGYFGNCNWLMTSTGLDYYGNKEVFSGTGEQLSFYPTLLGEYELEVDCERFDSSDRTYYTRTINVLDTLL